jgi:hypothetical protein
MPAATSETAPSGRAHPAGTSETCSLAVVFVPGTFAASSGPAWRKASDNPAGHSIPMRPAARKPAVANFRPYVQPAQEPLRFARPCRAEPRSLRSSSAVAADRHFASIYFRQPQAFHTTRVVRRLCRSRAAGRWALPCCRRWPDWRDWLPRPHARWPPPGCLEQKVEASGPAGFAGLARRSPGRPLSVQSGRSA